MVRTSGPDSGNAAIGNLSKRIKRQKVKANKITKVAQKTARDMRQSHDQSMVLQERFKRQVSRVMHAWKITHKLQLKYHKMKQVKIAKQIHDLKTSGRIIATPGQSARYDKLKTKLEEENRVISKIQHAYNLDFTVPSTF